LIDTKTALRWLRIIHRDLGFLMVGVCLIYGISGILLNHMKGKDPAFKTEQKVIPFEQGLDKEKLAQQWSSDSNLPTLKKIIPVDDDKFRITFQGGMGSYDSATGIVEYEKNTKRVLIFWINKLHYNQVKGWSMMADFFAVGLIFFAVSGLLIVRGKRGLPGTGKWFLLIGLLIPVLYILFT